MDKRRKKRVWFLTVLATVAALSLFVFSGCAKLASAINDIKGSLIGNQYTIYTYDNFGNLVLETSGKKIDIAGNPVKNTSYDENGKVIEQGKTEKTEETQQKEDDDFWDNW